MIKTIMKKELLEIIGSRKFLVTFSICSLFIILAFFVGTQNYKKNYARYQAACSENLRQFSGLTDWTQVTGFKLFLPPRLLESLVTGVSNDIGRTIKVYGRGELSTQDSRNSGNPLFAVFQFLDLTFIFQIVLSLFAVFLTYNSVNGEKEQGTLRLTFSNAVPKDKFILGKMTGSLLALVLPLSIPILLGCLLMPLQGIHLQIQEWLQLGLVLLTGIVYVASFLFLSIFVSVLTKKSSTSFLVLLALWIVFVFIIPNSSVVIAGHAVDVPSVDYMNYQKGQYRAQLFNREREKLNAFKPSSNGDMEKMLQEFEEFMDDLGKSRNEKMQEYTNRLNEQRLNKQIEQQKLAFGFSRLSPSAVFTFAVTRLAGSFIDLNQHFLQQAGEYQAQFLQFMKSKTGIVPDKGAVIMKLNDDNSKQETPINLMELPEFNYQDFAFTNSIQSALLDIFLLVMLNVVLFFAAFLAFSRYDVR